jgi:hypothetical protein
MRAKTLSARNAGSDYLNVVFGWLPFVSDLRKMARAVIKSHEILESYHKHGDRRKIRRRYAFPTQSDIAEDTRGNFLPVPSDVNYFGQGSIITRRQQDMWFSGAYRYYIPTADSTLEKFRSFRSDAQKLFGVDVTPEVVWNVSPWSWLVDWQANVGDVLHNISALGRDGLVMQYGYVMCHNVHEISVSATFNGVYSSRTTTTDFKVRRPANPYGFGVDWEGLTPKQLAILAALGLSRK